MFAIGHGGGGVPSISGSARGIGRWAKEAISSGVGSTTGSSWESWPLAGAPVAIEVFGAPCVDFFQAAAKCLLRYVLSTAESN